jgi:hypothetical protein
MDIQSLQQEQILSILYQISSSYDDDITTSADDMIVTTKDKEFLYDIIVCIGHKFNLSLLFYPLDLI